MTFLSSHQASELVAWFLSLCPLWFSPVLLREGDRVNMDAMRL